jgi:sugar/nucleoside kinase (ribokinase family)
MKKKVLGMGNALVDIMTILTSNDVLTQFNLPKGSMQLVDQMLYLTIQENTNHLKKQLASGGSAANTIHGIAKLGVETGFIGKVGTDEMGQFFKVDLTANNIAPFLIESETPSGVATALVSPDSERTFATFLGAACELEAKNINHEHFNSYDIFHIEGYLVQNHELIETAIKTAKLKNLKVSIDMASYNVVESNLDFLKRIIEEHVDIIFANEDEARAFTGMEPEQAIVEFAKYCDIAVVKVGSKGSLILKDGIVTSIEGRKANCIDTTGAGDIYASGFLFGLANNLPLDVCGKIGTILATKVVEVIGPKLSEAQWKEAKIEIDELIEKNQ